MKENSLFKWIKCDLHFHTPVSNQTKNDYRDTKVSVEDIISKLNEFNVNLVTITDHNIFNLEQYNKLIEKSNNLIKFLPGVELKVDKYDVVLIIEPTDFNLQNFDNKIKEFCKKERQTGKGTTEELVEIFQDFSYILIPEYNRGGGGDKVHKIGTSENDKFKLQLLTGFYDAADIKNAGTIKKTIDYFKEMFEFAQTHREGNCIFVTDNHDINYYPNKDKNQNNTFRGWTFINSEPTFYGLKMAFSDPSRFYLTEQKDGNPPFINKRDDFLINKIYIKNNEKNEEQELNLSPYLNCVVGPRSSGKSYLVKKIVSKFDKEQINKYELEYKDFWKKYDVKIEFINGVTINYNENSNSEKVIYLEQNHVIRNIEDNELFKNWYKIFETNPPNIDNQKINLKKIELEKNIKLYYELILKIRENRKELNYESNIFRSSDIIVNKGSNNINLLTKLKENIKQFEAKIETEEDFDILEAKIDLELDNFYINDKDIKLISENIKNIINILNKANLIKEKFNKGLNSVKQFIEHKLKDNLENIQKPLEEFNRLKSKYKLFANSIKELMNLKNKIWNEENKKFLEQKNKELKTHKKVDNWEFTKEISLNFNNEFIKEQLKKIFKSNVLALEKKENSLNPLLNLTNFLFVEDNKIFNQKTKIKQVKELNFIEEIETNDIVDDNNESYIKTSPGGKANIILKLLLNKERLKNKIIIIDQPEDSLDNRTITNWLVESLKDIKFHNQIIVITHNSNIVINGDAQNVIVPNRINVENIEYLTGTFESKKQWDILNDKNEIVKETIFENILENLEGGKKTLLKRMDKWKTLITERIDLNVIKSEMRPKRTEN